MNIEDFVQENYAEFINDIQSWVDKQYNEKFKGCFDSVRDIHKSMQSSVRTISDSELEWILTELPMKLFSISESLNAIRLDAEVIKLRKKSIKSELDKVAADMVKAGDLVKTDSKNWVENELVDHDILIAAYTSLITRVESEISFSRELIMGCKKIWDSRRKTEGSNPVGEVVPGNIPDYAPNPNRYREPYIR